ncbi:MAG: hypothetical protein JRG80_19200 [Deltaproteobacteria bacterium]|nr:hypothetical protein [Deltaproteobacteria bacterium]
MLSTMDDHLLHQIAEPFRHVGTSDRNFYDRYYFNMHSCSDELFVVMGMGQYPNLAVQDAFALVRHGRKHTVVRGSRVIGDRMDTSVGPIRVEVIEGLKKLRFIVEPNEHGIEMDVCWEGSIPVFQEPRHYIRRHGRTLYDSVRFAQTGFWTGRLCAGGKTYEVTPDRWWGARDHSWGVRPVGEAEPPGIHVGVPSMDGMWNYAPMQFDDFSILYICNERNDGERPLEESMRIWRDPAREPEWLGRPESEHVFRKGTRYVERSTVYFPDAPGGGLEVKVTPMIECYVGFGTGYGFEADWRHGMYQGELVVQGVEFDTVDDAETLWGLCDTVARFEMGSEVGYGLWETGFFGPFDRYGLKGFNEGAV